MQLDLATKYSKHESPHFKYIYTYQFIFPDLYYQNTFTLPEITILTKGWTLFL